jgi:hypothetical protein
MFKSQNRQLPRHRRQRRKGMATLELVMATAIGFPMFALLLYWGIHACRALFSIIGSMIGSPLM